MSKAGGRSLLNSVPLRLAIAVAMVALGNLALFAMVKVEPPAQKVRHRTWPKVYLFPLDEEPATDAQRELLDWIDLLDPTLLSLPSEKRGFSRVRQGEFVRPLLPSKAWDLTLARADLPTIVNQPLTMPEPDLLAKAAALVAAAPPELPPRARYRPPVMEPGVYWLDAQGEFIANPPAIEFAEMPEGVTVQGATRLRAAIGEQFIRCSVTASCGDRRLDAQALSALQKWLGPNPKQLPAGAKPTAGLLALAVQWRWLPGVRLSQPELDRTIWNGEDWRAFNWR